MTELNKRLYFLDWARVLAFGLLIVFHSMLPFTTHRWEINNQDSSPLLTRLMWWLHQWRLPLLFFISGAGIRFSLQKRGVLRFAGERFVRLFIPLLFAMFFIIPLQVYFEWMQDGKINMTYAAFYPEVWKMIPYPEGVLTWSHMWFIVYLFVYILLLLPVFGLFRIPVLNKGLTRIADWLSSPWGLLLLLLPLLFIYDRFYIRYPEQGSLLDDWFIFCFYLSFLIFGYLLSHSERFWETAEKYRWYYLGIAGISITFLYVFYWWDEAFPKTAGPTLYLYSLLNSLEILCIISGGLGLARKHLNYNTPALQYLNQAVYPYFILHQTVIVAFGYYIVQWPAGIIPKFFFLTLLSLLAITGIYHVLIRPFILTRFLFGVKFRKK